MLFLHFHYLCNTIRPLVRYYDGDDSSVHLLLEMLDKIGTIELFKSEEFQKILCKKIYEHKWISQNIQNGIPEFYEYVNS
jgi:hypothetical protein